MAANYQYKLTTGATTVEYNISPSFAAGFNLAGTVNITGRVMNTNYPVESVIGHLSTTTTGTTNYMYDVDDEAIGFKGAWVRFTLALTKQGASTFPNTTQAIKVYTTFTVNVVTGVNIAQSIAVQGDTTQSGYLFNWHTAARIADGSSIVRCDEDGTARPDGDKLRFDNFQVLTHASSTLTGIKFVVTQSGATSGNTYSVTSTSSPVKISNLTSSRYTEAKPSFFGLTINSAYVYNVLISYTDAYETTQQMLSVPRGSPILDFSLDDKGGLAVGQYYAVASSGPQLQVEYPSVFNGGITGGFSYTAEKQSDNSYNTEALTGGVWVDGKQIWRKVYRGKRTFNTSTNSIVAINLGGSIDSLIYIQGFVKDSTGLVTPIPCAAPSVNYVLTFRVQGNMINLYYQPNGGWTGTVDFAVVIEYTRV